MHARTVTPLHLQPQPALIDQVHARLVAAIADGTLAPGARITQESLADLLGVSRQPVSHALQMLKRAGLVTEHGKRGLAVAPIDADRIRDLYQVRAALEGLAARLAAQRVAAGIAEAAIIAAASAALERGRRLGADAPRNALIAADVAFHSAIHKLSGNAAVEEMVAERWPHFMRSMGHVLAVSVEVRTRIWHEHALILAAILAGDDAAAEKASATHTASAGEAAARSLEQHTVLDVAKRA